MPPSVRHAACLAPVPSAAALRAGDAAVVAAGLAPEVLMETAGRGAARWLRRLWPGAARVQVLCGPGGNGGDGYVVARGLAARGVAVDVVAVAPPSRPDTRAMHDALLALADRLPGAVRVHACDGLAALAALPRPDVRVDALVGTGSRLPLGGVVGEIVAWMNEDGTPVLALDLPSGLHADTGTSDGPAVRAAATATFAAPSPGLLLADGPALAGRLVVVDVGVPRGVLDAAIAHDGGAWASTDAWIGAAWPRRAADAHKFTAGSVLVVGGSPAYTGAPVLAALAAARGGAGYVRVATDARSADTVDRALPTVPVTRLPVTRLPVTRLPVSRLPVSARSDARLDGPDLDGPDLDGDGFGDAGLDPDASLAALGDALARASALVVGPGLGRAPGTQAFVRALLRATDRPCVVDADALAALDDPWLRAHGRPSWVLTPHAGELARLAPPDLDTSGFDTSGVDASDPDAPSGPARALPPARPPSADRLARASALAARWNVTLVAKGAPSLVATPGGEVYIARPRSASLATAGTGDVLAGLSGALLARGLAPAEAALAALHAGGRAAQVYGRTREAASMLATDLLDALPRALHALLRSRP